MDESFAADSPLDCSHCCNLKINFFALRNIQIQADELAISQLLRKHKSPLLQGDGFFGLQCGVNATYAKGIHPNCFAPAPAPFCRDALLMFFPH